jgi:hypothetical protein
MTQSTGGITAKDAKLEYSLTSATAGWVDMSGVTNKVTPGGGDRTVSEYPTLGDENPILGVGRQARITETMTILYTRLASDPYHALLTAKRSRAPVWLRISPEGGQVGEDQFTGGPGYIQSMPPAPELDANSEKLLETVIVWTGPDLTPSVATS